MKKLVVVISFFFFTSSAFAQDDEVAVPEPKAREKINAARAAYITERLSLTPDEAEKFWPLYHEYVQKRQGLRQQYRVAKKNGESETMLLDLDLKIKQQELDLEKEYSARFVKIIPAQKLIILRQAELDFKKLLLRQIEQRQMRNPKRMRLRDQ